MAAQEPGQIKEDPRDFALWQGRKPQEDTWWDAPWGGRGRPGWHVECSAMAEKHLGPGFEVHGGGLDLRFPHHESELAQSRGAGRPFARTWMHNGMIELGAEKMSKSIGNIVSLREALDRWGREAILVFFLGAHYRNPLEYSDITMQAAHAQVDDFRRAFRVAAPRPSELTWKALRTRSTPTSRRPGCSPLLHGWRAAGELDLLARGLAVFGLAIDRARDDAPAEAHRLAVDRQAARARRDYAAADRLRVEIERSSWEQGPTGTDPITSPATPS